ncbi:hypothetical protein HAX54_012288, partial [Datura stramonium]|nr:hypothetical protein [Datura stramonium]
VRELDISLGLDTIVKNIVDNQSLSERILIQKLNILLENPDYLHGSIALIGEIKTPSWPLAPFSLKPKATYTPLPEEETLAEDMNHLESLVHKGDRDRMKKIFTESFSNEAAWARLKDQLCTYVPKYDSTDLSTTTPVVQTIERSAIDKVILKREKEINTCIMTSLEMPKHKQETSDKESRSGARVVRNAHSSREGLTCQIHLQHREGKHPQHKRSDRETQEASRRNNIGGIQTNSNLITSIYNIASYDF